MISDRYFSVRKGEMQGFIAQIIMVIFILRDSECYRVEKEFCGVGESISGVMLRSAETPGGSGNLVTMLCARQIVCERNDRLNGSAGHEPFTRAHRCSVAIQSQIGFRQHEPVNDVQRE